MKIQNSNNAINSNFDIDKLIFEAKTQMKLLNFKKAYDLLKVSISKGLSHSDIFYLFGEVCRILKKFEESENYLIESIKFEQHSPYVLFSLGLLYYEKQDFYASKNFLRHFLALIKSSSEANFMISKCYVELQKYIKALHYITNAIENNKNILEYFEFRARIYEMIGLKAEAANDLKYVKFLN